MRLSEFLEENDLSDAEFGALINRDRTTVLRWRRGLNCPDMATLKEIAEATGGKVMPNDFLTGSENAGAVV